MANLAKRRSKLARSVDTAAEAQRMVLVGLPCFQYGARPRVVHAECSCIRLDGLIARSYGKSSVLIYPSRTLSHVTELIRLGYINSATRPSMDGRGTVFCLLARPLISSPVL